MWHVVILVVMVVRVGERVGEGLVGSDSDRLLSRSRDPDLFFISVSVLMHANKLLPYSLIAPTHLLLLLHLLLSHCTRPPNTKARMPPLEMHGLSSAWNANLAVRAAMHSCFFGDFVSVASVPAPRQ